ncbi:Uncharacterized protein BP5553_00068 [Venustampulla echinocandica]|uniref:Velvet domain-containing protein n=1 Tax=Venustampulla echinocandica TaxID=2656787 RepID=A0A370TX43_9HELO|nr:Uncharacterized protein BP5553_00068 [Venustampulla echinocandica]RDL40089.1 Uncharacterized protein BP5553_00068 [Venustampulla echinocandica]
MNTAYAQQPPSPSNMHRQSIPNMHEAAYRSGAPTAPHYPVSHTMPLPSQSQIAQGYSDPYNSMAVTRAPIPETHPSEGLAPLVPGTQPAAPDPLPRSCIENGWKYELCVTQQPQRARMCGFGDKDRRPITPPPCVRLIITDIKTGKECDVNDIDHGMFVLNVDLWSADGTREVNLVRHSQTSPSISLTTPVSYAQVQDAGGAAYSNILPGQGAIPRDVKFEHGGGASYTTSNYNPYPGPPQVNPYTQSPPAQVPAYGGAPQYHAAYPNNPNAVQAYPPQNGYSQAPGQPVYFSTGAQIHGGQGLEYAPSPQPLPSQSAAYGGRPYTPADMNLHRMPVTSTQPGGMFTRNLIGSLAASAFRLTDPDDRIGIWFVLQDLSVRTEGTFRLRFSFVNVGVSSSSPTSATGSSNGMQPMTQVNTGKAPVLAACFSDCFTVYSAKRFPGVVESTNLSKCFATQGIKIPIRKDGQGPTRADRDKEYEDD